MRTDGLQIHAHTDRAPYGARAVRQLRVSGADRGDRVFAAVRPPLAHSRAAQLRRGGRPGADRGVQRRPFAARHRRRHGRTTDAIRGLRLDEGVWHIWLGFDHILDLVSLLPPAVLARRDGGWTGAASFHDAFWDVARIVTAFTLAHSITLTLPRFGIVSSPSDAGSNRPIALSVALAAPNNIFPVVPRLRYWRHFRVFGSPHGFGFAVALADLGLPAGSLALSLAGST